MYFFTNDFSDRLEVARNGGCAFLQKSMPPCQILESATEVLQQARIPEARVMVVEDDPQKLTIIQNSLKPWGFKLKTLENPQHF